MTAGTETPYRSAAAAGRDSFWHLVHAEWTKFRTVRGWVIAMIVAILVLPAFVFIASSGGSSCHASGAGGGSACPSPPTGPGGEPVNDAFYFVHQPLTGNGTITAAVTSLTGQQSVGPNQMAPGLQPWSKAGIIIKENTSQGSAYAAMMVTGSNGVRMQWDYVNDTPGLAGRVSASSPRWLRLVRVGGTITGYDSADGTHWTLVGTVTLPGLTSTVPAGLFAAGTGTENPTVATGVFRHIGLSWPATRWTGTNVGGVNGPNGVGAPGTLRQSAGTITVTGYGDISPQLSLLGAWSIQRALDGTALGLIFVPYLLAIVPSLQPGPGGPTGGGLGLGAREWLLRITPAAGFSIQQAVPRFPQVTGVIYTPNWGYDPLAPWAGFAVECAWAAAALALALYLLRRRDA